MKKTQSVKQKKEREKKGISKITQILFPFSLSFEPESKKQTDISLSIKHSTKRRNAIASSTLYLMHVRKLQCFHDPHHTRKKAERNTKRNSNERVPVAAAARGASLHQAPIALHWTACVGTPAVRTACPLCATCSPTCIRAPRGTLCVSRRARAERVHQGRARAPREVLAHTARRGPHDRPAAGALGRGACVPLAPARAARRRAARVAHDEPAAPRQDPS